MTTSVKEFPLFLLRMAGNPLSFSDKILAIRQHFGLSQDALAAKIGVSGAAIGFLQTGRTKSPGADLLASLTTELGVSAAWLLTSEGPMLTSEAQAQNLSPYPATGTREVTAIGPLSDQPHVDLPAPDMMTLAHFGQNPGLSLQSFANSPTLRLYLGPDEMPEKYVGAIVVTIFGDSMEPELHDGERMVVWFVPESKWEQIHNTVCVVSYDDTVTIKGIAENDLYEHNRLKLRAANPPTSYFVVGRNTIHSMWEVREYYDRPKYTPAFIRR